MTKRQARCLPAHQLLETDPSTARRIGRAYIAWYLQVENFHKSLLWQGFTEDDLVGDGSDLLVDAIVAWGDEDAVCGRVQAHLDADLGLESYRRVAPALLN